MPVPHRSDKIYPRLVERILTSAWVTDGEHDVGSNPTSRVIYFLESVIMNYGSFVLEDDKVIVIVIKKMNIGDYFAAGEASNLLMKKK